MARRSDSITFGFRTILRDPAVFLIELIWRWSFGIAAVLILFWMGLSLAGPTAFTRANGNAWSSRDPFLITQATLRLLREIGHRPLVIASALVLTVVWVVFGALGRTLTLKRLSEKHSIQFRNSLTLQLLRALFLWIGIGGAIAAMMVSVWVAMRGSKPDYLLYFVLVVPLLGIVWVFCAVVNWYLSLAAVCFNGTVTSASLAIQRAMVLASSQTAAVAGITAFFGVLRGVALLIAFVVCVFSAGLMVSAPRVVPAWLVLVALGYFAFADFLYSCRLAAYVALDEEAFLGESVSAFPGTSPPTASLKAALNGHS
jgi:hypothetical protein